MEYSFRENAYPANPGKVFPEFPFDRRLRSKTTVKLGYNELGYNELGYNEQIVQSQNSQSVILLHK